MKTKHKTSSIAKRYGYLLLELSITILFTVIIILYSTNLLFSIYLKINNINQANFLDNYQACQIISNDLSSAPQNLSLWKTFNKQELKYKNFKGEINSFFLKNKTLTKQTKYPNGSMHNRKLLRNIEDFAIQYFFDQNKQKIKGLKLYLKTKNKNFSDEILEHIIYFKG